MCRTGNKQQPVHIDLFKNQWRLPSFETKVSDMKFCGLCFIASLLFVSAGYSQITMTFPKATTYANQVPVGWTTTSAPSEIKMIWTYVSGSDTTTGAVWQLTFSKKNTVPSGAFTFRPLLVTTDTNFSAVTPAVPMADGAYKVYLQYKRASDGVTFSSSTVILSIDDKTLPPTLSLPASNSFLQTVFSFAAALKEASNASSRPTLQFANGADTITLTLKPSMSYAFNLNVADLKSSNPAVFSATPNTLAEGTYNVVFKYSDAFGHSPASAINYNVVFDTTIAPPVLFSPKGDTLVKPKFDIDFSLPEIAKDSSVKIVFNRSAQSDTLSLLAKEAGSYALQVNADDLSATPYFLHSTINALPDGKYLYSILYQDRAGNKAMVTDSFRLSRDTVAEVPSIISPVGDSLVKPHFNIDFTLPETAMDSSMAIVFNQTITSDTVHLSITTPGNYSLPFYAGSLASTPYYMSSTTDSLPEGNYVFSLLYKDTIGNFAMATDSFRLSWDTIALTPQIVELHDSLVKPPFTIGFTLPEPAKEGSVKIVFTQQNNSDTLTLSMTAAGDYIVPINPDSLSVTPYFVSSTTDTLPDGKYVYTILYEDSIGNMAMATDSFRLSRDTIAGLPVILSPVNDTLVRPRFSLDFNLPEAAQDSSVIIVFQSAMIDTLHLNITAPGNYSLPINADQLSQTPGWVSSTSDSLPDGRYIFSVLYKDLSDNMAIATDSFILSRDNVTLSPVLSAPLSGSFDTGIIHITFTLPEAAKPNSVKLVFAGDSTVTITLNADTAGVYTYMLAGNNLAASEGVVASTSSALLPGVYTVTVVYEDTLGNAPATDIAEDYTYTNQDVLAVAGNNLYGFCVQMQTHLQWTGTKETSYFDVERSVTGRDYTAIGRVAAKSGATYSFTDIHPAASKNLYRLKVVNKDGSIRYSNTISITGSNAPTALRVFPNPVRNELHVLLAGREETHTLMLWTLGGKQVKVFTIPAHIGDFTVTLPVAGLPAGTYILRDGNLSVAVVKL